MLTDQLTLLNGFAALVALCTLIALRHWRLGLYLGVLVGVAQDPVRKLIPATPGLLAISSAPVFWAAMLSGLASGELSLRRFRQAFPRIAGWCFLFALSLPPAVLVMLRHGGDVYRLALVGLYSWVTPLAAVLVGVSWVRRPGDLRRFCLFYCALTALLLSGTLLEYRGTYPDWPALGTWAMDANWDRHEEGVDIGLTTGFYRAPDLMSWHAATLIVLSLLIAQHESRLRLPLWLGLAGYAAVCLLLGGRRKMIALPLVWLAVFLVPLIGSGRLARAAAVLAAAALAVLLLLLGAGGLGVVSDYFVYAGLTGSDTPDRLGQVLSALASTWRQDGALGLGVGAAAQGAQHLGLGVRSWQEDGLSRLLVELGLLGFATGIGLFTTLAATLIRQLRVVGPTPHAVTHYALTAFAAANAASFVISHQAYGDSVLMFLSGMLLGVALSVPHWPHRFAAAARS